MKYDPPLAHICWPNHYLSTLHCVIKLLSVWQRKVIAYVASPPKLEILCFLGSTKCQVVSDFKTRDNFLLAVDGVMGWTPEVNIFQKYLLLGILVSDLHFWGDFTRCQKNLLLGDSETNCSATPLFKTVV